VQVVRYLRTTIVALATLKTCPSIGAFVEEPIDTKAGAVHGLYLL
jgi:hypothetical protein